MRGAMALILVACTAGGWGCRGEKTLSDVRADVRRAYPDVATLSTAELADLLDTDRPPLLLDTRTREEFEVSHLPGAVWADENGRAADAALRTRPAGRPVVVYCSVGHRSAEVARRLTGEGVADVRNLDGSIFLWSRQGRALVDGSGASTTRVHPYNSRWGRLLSPP